MRDRTAGVSGHGLDVVSGAVRLVEVARRSDAFQHTHAIEPLIVSFDGIGAEHGAVDGVPELACVDDGLMWLGVGFEVQGDSQAIVLLFKPLQVAVMGVDACCIHVCMCSLVLLW